MQILLSAERVQERVAELARQIAADYDHQPVTIVGVLTGCLMFLADLVRHLDLPLRIALIQATSYRGAVTNPGRLRIHPDLLPDLSGRHLRGLEIASLRIAVLLRKQGRQQIPLEPDYCGFDIPNAFVVGYGLDYNDEYRHLPYIAVLDESNP
jgi:hypoxanthine phosphoribosyltransferase